MEESSARKVRRADEAEVGRVSGISTQEVQICLCHQSSTAWALSVLQSFHSFGCRASPSRTHGLPFGLLWPSGR